ncbi:hypothetical protein [Fulvivirga lutea]|uniref:Uncharacterized protein n=1 Tax=Fulvivirga lutea TaxID=2810512 RepID=A0A975A228_9BACT|nr:hypothetical protein [Fulvivirga lutea]QSE98991.1 hypothetical protein JR347_07870 [Fulvivirga lutea]
MKINQLFFIIPLFWSCTNQAECTEKVNEPDTIYAYHRKDYHSSLPIVEFSSKTYLKFKIGQADTVTIKVKNFSNYESELRNEIGASVKKIDNHLYSIKPLDSIFNFEIWQNYDSGLVVRKVVDNSGKEEVIDYNGWHLIGKEEFTAE